MKLADWLFESNVTPEQLRRMLGVRSRTTIHRYLTGERTPRKEVVLKIAEITCGRVQLIDFVDSGPPQCATRVLIDGKTRLVFPWTDRGGRLEIAQKAEQGSPDRWPSPPLAAAIQTLGTRAHLERTIATEALSGTIRRQQEAAGGEFVTIDARALPPPKRNQPEAADLLAGETGLEPATFGFGDQLDLFSQATDSPLFSQLLVPVSGSTGEY